MIYLSKEEDFKLCEGKQVLYFYTTWMDFYKKTINMIDKVENKELTFIAIDADYFKSLVKRYNVDSVPYFILLNNGIEIKRAKGVMLTSAFKSIFSDI